MNENENAVIEQTSEAVTEGTEQPKLYTEDEFNSRMNEIMGKRLARKEAKVRKEVEGKYSELIEVLKAGTGKSSVKELTDTLKDFYEKRGVVISDKSEYSPRDIEILAKAEAQDIIQAGFDEVVEEVENLSRIGVDNMSARDKAVFKTLVEHRTNVERSKNLSELGVTPDVYESADFKEFASKFKERTPIKDVYDLYVKTKPKNEIQTMGSMTNTASDSGTVKDFYSFEEAKKFTKKDFDSNPELFKRVVASMPKWRPSH